MRFREWHRLPDRQRASDASLRRRLEVATERNRQLEAENRHLREALAVALGEQRAASVVGQLGVSVDLARMPIGGLGCASLTETARSSLSQGSQRRSPLPATVKACAAASLP